MLNRIVFATVFIIFLLSLQACSLTPYEHGSLENSPLTERVVSQEHGAFLVRAAVPSEKEAADLFGIPIYKRGIQPVYLEITNNSKARARFILSSVDRDYFSPLEVAYMHKKYFSKQGWMDMEKFLYQQSMPRMIMAGQTEKGFVFTHLSSGTKSFNVDIFHTDDDSNYEEFTFFVEVPGFLPDHADVDFKSLYATADVQRLDENGFREAMETFPCCSSNQDGSKPGKPLNIVLVADTGLDILQALLRAGWLETSYEKDDIYLNNSNYLFGRPPDAVFKKSRGKTTERNELSLWLSPYLVDGKTSWVAQMKHAIGRRYEIEEFFLGTAQDPDIDDGRNFLLQNLWYSNSLEGYTFLKSGEQIPPDNPALDFDNNPYYTDGLRLVMWLSGEPISLEAVRNLAWLDTSPTGAKP